MPAVCCVHLSLLMKLVCIFFFLFCTTTFNTTVLSSSFFRFLHACTFYTNYSVRIIEFMPVIASYPPQRCELPHRLRSYELQHLGSAMALCVCRCLCNSRRLSCHFFGHRPEECAHILRCFSVTHIHTHTDTCPESSSIVLLFVRLQM